MNYTQITVYYIYMRATERKTNYLIQLRAGRRHEAFCLYIHILLFGFSQSSFSAIHLVYTKNMLQTRF